MAVDRALFPTFKPSQLGIGVVLGKLMNVSVAENFTQLSALNDYRGIFNYAAVTLGSTYFSAQAYYKAFGAYVKDNKIIDQPIMGVPGSFGYIVRTTEDGMKKWCVVWIESVTFMPPPESAITKSSATTFTTPSITGIARENGKGWRKKVFFDTAEEAKSYLKREAGIE